MEIPVHLYSQLDECLRLLRSRRETVLHQINEYKTTQLAESAENMLIFGTESNAQNDSCECKNKVADGGFEGEKSSVKKREGNSSPHGAAYSTSLSSKNFSDTNSDVSSCMDSNYDSDYSARSASTRDSLISDQSSKEPSGLDELYITNKNLNKSSFDSHLLGLLGNQSSFMTDLKQEVLSDSTSLLSNDRLNNTPNKNSNTMSIDKCSNRNSNSDDSDATVNELTLNENDVKSKSTKLRIGNGDETAGEISRKIKLLSLHSNSSDNTTTPSSPRAFNPILMNGTDENSIEKETDITTNSGEDNSSSVIELNSSKSEIEGEQQRPIGFARQMSDGYSSLPLSASSVISEHSSSNPFFASVLEKSVNSSTVKISEAHSESEQRDTSNLSNM
jgi:hypothetical protein